MSRRNSLAMAACGLVALAAAPPLASANLLVNPSLESVYQDSWGTWVPTGWGLWQSAWEGWGSPSWITPHLNDGHARTGQNSWEMGSATPGYSLLIQDVFSLVPGTVYSLDAWVKDAFPSGSQSATEPALKMEFYDASNVLLAFYEDVIPIAHDGSYHSIATSHEAPPDTTWMKAICLSIEFTGGQSAYIFDDATLTPEPGSLALLALGALALVRRRG